MRERLVETLIQILLILLILIGIGLLYSVTLINLMDRVSSWNVSKIIDQPFSHSNREFLW